MASPARSVVAGGLALALIVSGAIAPARAQETCSSTPTYRGPDTRSAPADIWRTNFDRPIEGTLSADLRTALERALDRILTRVPGASVAVAIPGQGTWSSTRGLARRQPPTPVEAGQMFQAASTTKTFVAVVMLQLVAEGRLRLDDPVDRWFPGVPHAKLITIDRLLRHTNGLVSFNALRSLGPRYRTPADVIALAASAPPMFCPGADWAYTNTGYAMLGVIIEQVEGKPLRDVLAARVFTPLALSQTALRQLGDRANVVMGHASGVAAPVEDDYATPYAAGGLATTGADLVRFWHALLSGRILAPAVVRTMFTDMPAMARNGPSFYGAGVQLYDVPSGPGLMLGHSGGITGFTSVVAYLVADDAYVAVLVNDKDAAAEAGLWEIVRALRAVR